MSPEDVDKAIKLLLEKFDVRKVGSSKEHSRVFDGAMMALVCLREALEEKETMGDGGPGVAPLPPQEGDT
tara:strand:- start:10803 stop:11012 length:210 start_codon:yes stop_codon:yes gene_type:complete